MIERKVTVAASTIILGWLVIFLTGAADPQSSILNERIKAAFHSSYKTPWKYGDVVASDAVTSLRRHFGAANGYLVIRFARSEGEEAKRRYVRRLASVGRENGHRWVAVDATEPTAVIHATLRALDLEHNRTFTLLIDGAGTVLFSTSFALGADDLRQLIERRMTENASFAFDPPRVDRKILNERIEHASASTRMAIPQFDYVAVLAPIASNCATREHLSTVKSYIRSSNESLTEPRIAVIVPPAARHLLGPGAIQAAGMTAIVSDDELVPELEYITRDVDEASPVLMEIKNGRIVNVLQLIRSRWEENAIQN